MIELKNIGVFLFRNWHWRDVLTWHDIKKIGYVGYVINVKFACQLCQRWQPEMRFY
jgi:hypothetical protein